MRNSQGESWACRCCGRAFPNEATATLHPEFCEVVEEEVSEPALVIEALPGVEISRPPGPGTEPTEETVKQATLEDGPKDTFATEAEHNGYKAEQGVLI